MVRQYYIDEITSISAQELRPLCQTVEPPACLLGEWAVHMHVNDRFREASGREYIGSRDVDLGFHVNPDWGRDELRAAPVGQSVERVQEEGYTPVKGNRPSCRLHPNPEALASVDVAREMNLLSQIKYNQ